MNLTGSVPVVTGANRGLGRVFVEQLIARGAQKVYATARTLSTLDDLVVAHPAGRVIPLRVDVTEQRSIDEAAARVTDADLLINNAGIATTTDLVSGDLALIRAEIDTHFWALSR